MSDPWDRTKCKNIVIHHLGDGSPAAKTEAELRSRANPPQPGFPNGWQYPEYDYGILEDGTVITMRPLTVKGAHAIADRREYMLGPNWWNLNSASVVLGIDATEFTPPGAMVNSLINFLAKFCKEKGGGVGNMYPHFQITQTDCPGASYGKVGLSTGFLNYDYVEQSVDSILKGGLGPMDKPAVVVFGIWDLVIAYRLALKLNCPVIPRSSNWRGMGFNKFYLVGGPEENSPDVVMLSGNAMEDTEKAVLEELAK